MDVNPYASPNVGSLVVDSIDTPVERRCHKCGGSQFKTWTMFHPLILHWILNPGLAINELCFGQRIPRTTFICQNCKGWSRIETQFIECPGCKRFHSADIWTRCAFGNWFGLVCPDCGHSIPCVLNLTSLIILVVLFPVWFPVFLVLRESYRRWAQRRVVNSRQTAHSRPDRIK